MSIDYKRNLLTSCIFECSVDIIGANLRYTYHSTIGEHFFNTNVYQISYSDEFSLLHRAQTNNHLNILEAVEMNTQRPTLYGERERERERGRDRKKKYLEYNLFMVSLHDFETFFF